MERGDKLEKKKSEMERGSHDSPYGQTFRIKLWKLEEGGKKKRRISLKLRFFFWDRDFSKGPHHQTPTLTPSPKEASRARTKLPREWARTMAAYAAAPASGLTGGVRHGVSHSSHQSGRALRGVGGRILNGRGAAADAAAGAGTQFGNGSNATESLVAGRSRRRRARATAVAVSATMGAGASSAAAGVSGAMTPLTTQASWRHAAPGGMGGCDDGERGYASDTSHNRPRRRGALVVMGGTLRPKAGTAVQVANRQLRPIHSLNARAPGWFHFNP